MKQLKHKVRTLLPYHYCRNAVICIITLVIIMSCLTYRIYNAYKNPIIYNQSDVYSYMYLDVNSVSLAMKDCYFVNDDNYIYIYYDQNDALLLSRLTGIPVKLKEKDFNQLLPLFQEKYPQLKVDNIDDMKDYVGLYALKHTIIPMVTPIIIILGIDILLLIGIFIYLIKMLYYRYKVNAYLKTLSANHVFEQLDNPIFQFSTLKIVLLEDYFVTHQPLIGMIKYNDIQSIYIKKKSLFFFVFKLKLIVYDKNHKRIPIVMISGLSKKHTKDLYLLIEKLHQIDSTIMVRSS